MMRRLVPLLLLCLLCPGPASAGEPRLYLAWNAPYGHPRASDTLSFACGSMTRLDTLYLSFDPGQNSSSYTGFTAALWVRALDGDTLTTIWDSPSSTGLPLWMRVEFNMDSTYGCPSPFLVPGAGGAACRPTVSGGRVIRMVHAVSFDDSVAIEGGRRYGLARFIFRQPARSPGCGQPVCIEFSWATISTLGGRHTTVAGNKQVGVRLNPITGKGCFDPGSDPAGATPWMGDPRKAPGGTEAKAPPAGGDGHIHAPAKGTPEQSPADKPVKPRPGG